MGGFGEIVLDGLNGYVLPKKLFYVKYISIPNVKLGFYYKKVIKIK
jgi:hypothetical protein